jgi:hypothetical protein
VSIDDEIAKVKEDIERSTRQVRAVLTLLAALVLIMVLANASCVDRMPMPQLATAIRGMI